VRLKKAEREQVRLNYGVRCVYCGNDLGERWHADHFALVILFPDDPVAEQLQNTPVAWALKKDFMVELDNCLTPKQKSSGRWEPLYRRPPPPARLGCQRADCTSRTASRGVSHTKTAASMVGTQPWIKWSA
jgi:hypothetical protein